MQTRHSRESRAADLSKFSMTDARRGRKATVGAEDYMHARGHGRKPRAECSRCGRMADCRPTDQRSGASDASGAPSIVDCDSMSPMVAWDIGDGGVACASGSIFLDAAFTGHSYERACNAFLHSDYGLRGWTSELFSAQHTDLKRVSPRPRAWFGHGVDGA